jgi:hypothetical protein
MIQPAHHPETVVVPTSGALGDWSLGDTRVPRTALHHAAGCTARHGVGSQAEPPTMECAAPVT